MASFRDERQAASSGNKREKVVRKLSATEVAAGQWARAVTGTAHHFFVDGVSVCGRRLPARSVVDATRKLCPDCFAAVSRAI